jgi:hypothetical protein
MNANKAANEKPEVDAISDPKPPKPSTSEPNKTERPTSTFRTLVSENLKTVVVAVVTAGIGAFGFWLSPLREAVAHKIYRENAAILLTTDFETIREGNTVHLRVIVSPGSAIHVDKGVITILFDKQLLRLRSGQAAFPSPIIENPVVLPEGSSLEFLAIAPGTAEIKVQLQTKYGTYVASSKVVVEESKAVPEATLENLTALWELRIGESRGRMEIHQQGHTTITGSYFLDSGDKGVIDGFRDGDKFFGSFTRGNSITKWVINDADLVTNQGYLELKGTASLQHASPSGWAKDGSVVNFYATVSVR